MTAALDRATAYPYAPPPHSYLFVNGEALEIVDPGGDPVRDGRLRVDGRVAPSAEALEALGAADAEGLDGRAPVLAYGSNAAPEQLARKYGGFAGDVVIPVLRARLSGYDVVYSAHFTRYGAIPATLEPSAGTVAEVAVVFLTPGQLAVMHESEIAAVNYSYGRLSGLTLALDGAAPRDAAFVYLTRYGSLALSGAPLALAAIAAGGRRFAAASEREVLGLARDRLAPGRPLDAFILETVEDEALRRARTAELRRHARPPEFSGFEVIEE